MTHPFAMLRRLFSILSLSLLLVACGHPVTSPEEVDAFPPIYPDYVGVTVPFTIAPLNFGIPEPAEADRVDVVVQGSRSGSLHVSGRLADFPLAEWHELLAANRGDSLRVTVCTELDGRWRRYRPFTVYVSGDSIDYALVYRRIAPGYEVYSKMGIYERRLSDFDERPLLENTLVSGMCLNCHALNRTDPSRLSLHIRGAHGATLMQADGRHELLNTKTDSTISACVYPYWHPSGDYIAYSTNRTSQAFHVVKDERIEVFDAASDVLVCHPATHRLLTSPLLRRDTVFETFPVFSADGRTLYFCASKAYPISPGTHQKIRYDLCSIAFDPATGTFGDRTDTLVCASLRGKSVSFPRPSYDGRYLMFTLSDYGNFSIWHREADLWLLDLQTGESRSLDEVNSNDTESFHNWSSNSRWFVFSSRRDDGLYTRLYLAHVGADGRMGKPFLLPQKDPAAYYDESLYSFNVPDFTNSPVSLPPLRVLGAEIESDERVGLSADW